MHLLFVTMLCITLSATVARAETITLVADEWCPYNCAIDSDAPGIMVEIAKKAFEPEGITVDYKIIPWARAIETVRSGQYNALLGAAYGDAEGFIFPTTPQAMMRNSFYVKKGNSWSFKTMESLNTISLGVIASYSYGDEIDAYIARYSDTMPRIQIVTGEDAAQRNIDKLNAGRVDALIEASYVMEYHLKQRGMSDTIITAGMLPASMQDRLFIAFSPSHKDSKRYVAILNKAMERMKRTGELEAITRRYISSNDNPS
jgi:polar amino acid transport system substrate-binding protein